RGKLRLDQTGEYLLTEEPGRRIGPGARDQGLRAGYRRRPGPEAGAGGRGPGAGEKFVRGGRPFCRSRTPQNCIRPPMMMCGRDVPIEAKGPSRLVKRPNVC